MAELDFDKFTQDLKKAIKNNLDGHDGVQLSLCDCEGNPVYQIAVTTPDYGFELAFLPTQQLEAEMKGLTELQLRSMVQQTEDSEEPPEGFNDFQKAIWCFEHAIAHSEMAIYYKRGEIRLMKREIANLQAQMREPEASETKTPAEWVV